MPALVAACAGAAALTAAVASSSSRCRPRRAEREELPSKAEDQEPTPPPEPAAASTAAASSPEAPAVGADELLAEVARRSKAVLYIVSNKTNDKFSIPNLTKYLRMKGVSVHEGSTPEETVEVNAARLLELMDSSAAGSAGSAALRHELVQQTVPKAELEALFPDMKDAYTQQPLDYGRNSRYGDRWRISCYLVVMENWKPKIMPHEPMVRCLTPTMDRCTEAFSRWYCSRHSLASVEVVVMNAFVTRYRAIHEEDQLKKHIDGSNVDGSVILALPTDDPFVGGALHVWDGKPQQELVYHPNPGDTIFLDGAVWHQAKPITCGTRWALVLFLRLQKRQAHGGKANTAAAAA